MSDCEDAMRFSQKTYQKKAVKAYLKQNRPMLFISHASSTNTLAKLWAQDGCDPCSTIVARSQSQGRGRMGRTWQSCANAGVWMSIVYRPNLKIQKAPVIAPVTACAVTDVLREMGYDARIKWPNDVLINGKKVCGILTESAFCGNRIEYVVVGIGINVWHRPEDFDPAIRYKATSLYETKKQVVDTSKLAAKIMVSCDTWVHTIEADKDEEWMTFWQRYNTTVGNTISWCEDSKTYMGTALAIEPDGALKVRTADGRIKKLYGGEIAMHGVNTI